MKAGNLGMIYWLEFVHQDRPWKRKSRVFYSPPGFLRLIDGFELASRFKGHDGWFNG